jgi:hypothetical protein
MNPSRRMISGCLLSSPDQLAEGVGIEPIRGITPEGTSIKRPRRPRRCTFPHCIVLDPQTVVYIAAPVEAGSGAAHGAGWGPPSVGTSDG